jgi:hypothetical protein
MSLNSDSYSFFSTFWSILCHFLFTLWWYRFVGDIFTWFPSFFKNFWYPWAQNLFFLLTLFSENWYLGQAQSRCSLTDVVGHSAWHLVVLRQWLWILFFLLSSDTSWTQFHRCLILQCKISAHCDKIQNVLLQMVKFYFILFLLICAYNVWVIFPHFPSPPPLTPPPPPSPTLSLNFQAETILS